MALSICRRWSGVAAGWWLAAWCVLAQPALNIQPANEGRVTLRWEEIALGYALEEADTLAAPGAWRSAGRPVMTAAGEWSVTINPGLAARFYRLVRATDEVTGIATVSPEDGETGVAVTRETILEFSAPLAADARLDGDVLFAGFGGRRLLSRAELSLDRTRATLFYLEPLPGSATVVVVLDGSRLKDVQGRAVDADGDGEPGGTGVYSFDTLNLDAVAGTAVVGTVFASELAPGTDTGTNAVNRPLAGVTITVDGREDTLRAVTDAQGRFKLQPVPPGRFFVHIDGRTVTNLAAGIRYPDQAYYPYVGKAWEAVVGVTNNLAGGTGTIYLPLVQAGSLQPVSQTQDTTVSFPPAVVASNQALAGVSITVPANSLFNDNGTRGGRVGLAPVPPDRLPEPLPPGLEMPLVITVQTDGALNFDRPAPICFPNLPDPVQGVPLPPGSKQALISFNHKKGVWEAVASMTVSADGQLVCTDPGEGILQPGWHGVAPPPATPPGCEDLCCPEDDPELVPGNLGLGSRGAALMAGRRKKAACKPEPCKQPRFACESDCGAAERKCNAEAERAYQVCYDEFVRPLGCGSNFTPECNSALSRCERLRARLAKASCGKAWEECKKRCLECPVAASGRPASKAGPEQDAIALQLQAQLDQVSLLLDPYVSTGADIPPEVGQAAVLLLEGLDALAGGDAAGFLDSYVQALEAKVETAPEYEEDPGNAPAYPVWYEAEIQRGDGIFTLRGETGPFGQYSLFVPRDGRLLQVRFYDPRTRRLGVVHPRLRPAVPHRLPRFTLFPLGENAPDGDQDGLADLVEGFHGTDPRRRDTDGDGVSDGAEVEQGTDPLGGLIARTGVVASLATPGAAVDVATDDGVAVTAEGPAGVSVINIANSQRLVLAAHLDTPGTAQRVAVSRPWAAVADGNSGLAIIDFSDPVQASLRHQVPLDGVQAVAVASGLAYAGTRSGQVVVVDLLSGDRLRQTAPGAAIQDLALDGDHLYVLRPDRLDVISLLEDSLPVVGTVSSPPALGQNTRLSVAGGVAYTVSRRGYNTVDVRDPARPVLLSRGNTQQLGWKQIVPNGSGLGVAAVGANSTDDGPHDLSLYDLRDPRTNNVWITTLVTPGLARAVALHGGLAYVADDRAGLQVMSYLPYDSKGVPPTVRLVGSLLANGAEAGQWSRVEAEVTDDVQVRQVEFYVDGVRMRTDSAFPFELRFVAPVPTAEKKAFRLRARAEDTGGNFAWTEEFTVNLVPDATAPRVRNATPVSGARSVTVVQAFFNEPVRPESVTAASFRLLAAGPDGVVGTGDDIPLTTGNTGYRADAQAATWRSATPLPDGWYRAVLTTAIRDLAGNPLSQDYAWDFRVADAVFWAGARDGSWNEPLNWSTGLVPGPADQVVLDVPGPEVTVTIPGGTVRVRGLESHENLQITGGALEVSGVLDLRRNALLNGGTIRGGTLRQTGGARLIFGTHQGNTFDGMTVEGDLDLTNNQARLLVRNELTLGGEVRLNNNAAIGFAGTQTLAGGSIVFAGDSGFLSVEGGAVLTLGPTVVVRGKSGVIGQPVFVGGNGRLINQGIIRAEVTGGTLSIRPNRMENAAGGTVEARNGGNVSLIAASWSNAGTVAAAGGTLNLGGSFTNTGLLRSENALLILDADFTLASLGTLQRTGGTVSVRSVVTLGGGVLELNATTGSWVLEGGTVRGGTLRQTGGARLVFGNQQGNTFDGMTVEGDLDLTNTGARLLVRNGLTLGGEVRLNNNAAIGFAGTQTLAGGSIVFAGDSGFLSVEGGAVLTLGPAVVVRGKGGVIGQSVFLGGNGRLINQGIIRAEVTGGTLSIRPNRMENAAGGMVEARNGGSVSLTAASWSNAGTVAVNGGTLTVGGSFTNTGLLRSENALLILDADFTLASLGTLQRTGGTVSVRSVVTLGGGVLELNGTTGSWVLEGGTVRGGTLRQTGGARLVFGSHQGNTFDGMTVEGDLDLTNIGARLLIRNGLALGGEVRLNNSAAIGFAGTQTLAGGSIVFAGDSGFLSVEGGAVLTLGPAVVVRGKTGVIGQPVFQGGNGRLINQGTIRAEVTGGTLSIRPNRMENAAGGTVEARNGGNVSLTAASWSNAGTVAATGGTLTLGGSFTNSGVLRSENALLILDADFTLASLGMLQRTGGTVRVRGVVTLEGGVLELNETTGSWSLEGGTVRGGTLRQTGGARLVFATHQGNTFDGMTVEGDLDLTNNGARLLIRNGLTIGGEVRLNSNAAIGFAGTQTLAGGSIVFAGDSGFLSVDGGAELTLGPAVVVRGKSGVIGQPVFLGGTNRLINQGTIRAEVANGTIRIRANQFTNTGTLEELNGGKIVVGP